MDLVNVSSIFTVRKSIGISNMQTTNPTQTECSKPWSIRNTDYSDTGCLLGCAAGCFLGHSVVAYSGAGCLVGAAINTLCQNGYNDKHYKDLKIIILGSEEPISKRSNSIPVTNQPKH
ncbi:hypothetical protein J7438_10300 [Thalassotalea sp. G20_0]|uniref:hypothetical protein n=1 Tax=Thalassotalea sp. G20_0 TaxID=2821093 RepID=UPI001ADA8698|nr:hypothetical protein [Thalassotalea sp. G20_0]MBO9494475.1 hypothetical protein [Thalassotalea sp. G20_0]